MTSCVDCRTPISRGSLRCRPCQDASMRKVRLRWCPGCRRQIHWKSAQCRDCARATQVPLATKHALDGAGPLADTVWRNAALRAIDTWETWGPDGFSAVGWCGRLGQVKRQFERAKLAWRDLLGLDMVVTQGGTNSVGHDPNTPTIYRFTPDAVDRLKLIRDLLDRYYAWLPPLEKGPLDEEDPCALD